jgi:indole-3-glycerol phosphate synthase/phosphoribosylanthranilate isomerase
MAQDDIDLACRQLLFGNNKVCGLTNIADVQAVAASGAALGGFIFYPKSPRAITLEAATQIVCDMKAQQIGLQMVGVFVNADLNEIVNSAKILNLFAVQLHGNETELEIAALNQRFSDEAIDCQIWKAVAVDSQTGEIANKPAGVQRYLYDSKNGAQFGGTGERFDWHTIADKSQAMLAGGLDASNAYEASQQGFYGLDFNSGVESSAGIKDPQKLTFVFNELRKN